MKLGSPIRVCVAGALGAVLAAAPAALAGEPQPGAAARANHPPVRAGARPPTKQAPNPHLQQWMDHHRDLPVIEQQKALEHEPGFHDLPPQTQQQMRDRLAQLNMMSPQQRDRILQRTEALERMSAPERQQYRTAAQSFATMQPDRRRLVARAVVDLRTMPPEQRQAVMNSDRFRGQFSDAERSTLGSLLAAEPYAGPQASQ